jgi:NAD+ synthase
MCGGFNPLKDVWKTTVYQLARWRNGHKPAGFLGPEGVVIPLSILEKPPSAELKDNQTDQDTLPPYEKLDDILRRFIERGQTIHEIIAADHDPAMVNDLWRKLDAAEFKRQQAAPGVDISGGEFTREYRMPISNHFSPEQLNPESLSP